MARGLLEDRAELDALFDELAGELEKVGATARVVMVGGTWMLWHSSRMATRDVDSARSLGPDVKRVVARMASRQISPTSGSTIRPLRSGQRAQATRTVSWCMSEELSKSALPVQRSSSL